MQSSNETSPSLQIENINNILWHADPSTLRMFAQASSYLRSQSYLTLFKRLASQNQQESLKKILVDLYLNYDLLIKSDAANLLPAWIECLNNYRQLRNVHCIHRLLATGILIIIDKVRYDQLQTEFMGLLYLVARERPQLGNSILAALARAEGKDSIYNACKDAHKMIELLGDHGSGRALSINDVEMIIAPFIDIYQEEGARYFSPVVNARRKILYPKLDFYYKIFQVLIKKLPNNHRLLMNPSTGVRDLMLILKDNDFHHYIHEVSDILTSIQSRLKDKKFLQEYYDDVVEFLPLSEYLIVKVIYDAIKQMGPEDKLVEYFKERYYDHIEANKHSSINYARLREHLNKLEDPNNIMTAIKKMLQAISQEYTQGRLRAYITSIISELLLKISSGKFLSEFIVELYVMPNFLNTNEYEAANHLASVCRLPQLNEESVSNHLEVLFRFHEKSDCSMLSARMMVSLCQSIKSEKLIAKWRELFNSYVECYLNQEMEWFKNTKNFMYLECYLILLLNSRSLKATDPEFNNKLILCFEKISLLYVKSLSGNEVYVQNNLRRLLVDIILPNIKSININPLLLPHLFSNEYHYSEDIQRFTVPFLLSVNDEDIQKNSDAIINKLQDYLKIRNFESEDIINDVSLLLVKMPLSFVNKINLMLFTEDKPSCSIPKSITQYLGVRLREVKKEFDCDLSIRPW